MRLCVNVDHVATVREARRIDFPDPVEAALLAVKAGAYGITIHLREDRRHIQDHDVARMRAAVSCKLNLEMAVTPEIIGIALDSGVNQVTFVPEKREEITTEGGLDVISHENVIEGAIKRFSEKKVPVSLFIDPDTAQVDAAMRTGVSCIEINTGRYSECGNVEDEESEFLNIKSAALYAADRGLSVYAGHGLNCRNTKKIVSVKEIEELNIGHSIVSRALFTGFDEAVREMLNLLDGKRKDSVT